MGFLSAIKKVPVIGGIVSAGEGMVNIASAGIKVLNGIIKTFDRFPANLICGLIIILLTLVYEMMKITIIGYPIVFLLYIIPFLIRLMYIYARYIYFVIITAIVKSMDPEKDVDLEITETKSRSGSAFRKFIIFIQSCHPDPRQWYTYPQNHFGNSHQVRLGLACMNPCPSKYVPHFGGLICKKADRRVPRYCPRSMIMRAFENLPVDGSKNFVNSSFMKKYHEACELHEMPLTSYEKEYGCTESAQEMLTRGICQQARILFDNPEDVYHACHETFCKKGDRQPFCSHVDPVYGDVVDNDVTQLLKIPGLVIMAAFIFQMTRYYMYETQNQLIQAVLDDLQQNVQSVVNVGNVGD